MDKHTQILSSPAVSVPRGTQDGQILPQNTNVTGLLPGPAREVPAADLNTAELETLLINLELQTAIAKARRELAEAVTPKKSIYEAISWVMQQTPGHVAKNGKNTFQNYSYAMAADIIDHVRAAVAEAGIIITPMPPEGRTFENQVKKSGESNGHILRFTAWYRLTGPDGSFVEVPVETAGHDTLDKAAFKANTGGMKYLLTQVFLLPTGDDPEANNPAEKPDATPAKPNPAKNAAKPAATPATDNPAGNVAANEQPAVKPLISAETLKELLKEIDAGTWAAAKPTYAAKYRFTDADIAEIKDAVQRRKEFEELQADAAKEAEAQAAADRELAAQANEPDVNPDFECGGLPEQSSEAAAIEPTYNPALRAKQNQKEAEAPVNTPEPGTYPTAEQSQEFLDLINNSVYSDLERKEFGKVFKKSNEAKAADQLKRLKAQTVIRQDNAKKQAGAAENPAVTQAADRLGADVKVTIQPNEKEPISADELDNVIKYIVSGAPEKAKKITDVRALTEQQTQLINATFTTQQEKAAAKTRQTPFDNSQPAEIWTTYTKEPGGPGYEWATPELKQDLIRMVNNKVITRGEKTKLLLQINKMSVSDIKETIKATARVIAERETL